eukprot:TRINITY_DN2385_c0_g1_i2.p2 TRINITY_DN2385_c0_g1~~TRINITY_DN2385_c0_g1_i2.p2  ORF type:complete len:371 (+),score=37.88 TRINITY_DN2385_c0_g1_i2:1375-2487(+)
MNTYYHQLRIILADYEKRLASLKNDNNFVIPAKPEFSSARKKFKILSLDGGGMRGLLLIDLLHFLSLQAHKPITESFDLICGTSTGGIIAFALGFLGLPLKVRDQIQQGAIRSVEEFYWLLGKKIFAKESNEFKVPFFDASILETELKKAFGKKRLNELSTTNPISSTNLIRIFAASTRVKEGRAEPFLFRTYNKPEGSSYAGSTSFYVWEAARATSAAPIYFSEFVKEGETYIDGGVGTNNPTLLAINEARSILGNSYNEYDIEVVSLGTGHQTVQAPKIESLLGAHGSDLKLLSSVHGIDAEKLMHIGLFMLELATSSEVTHDHLRATMNNYIRINPPLKVHIDLSETDPDRLIQMLFEAACCVMPTL